MAGHTGHKEQGVGEFFITGEELFIPNCSFTLFQHHNNAV